MSYYSNFQPASSATPQVATGAFANQQQAYYAQNANAGYGQQQGAYGDSSGMMGNNANSWFGSSGQQQQQSYQQQIPVGGATQGTTQQAGSGQSYYGLDAAIYAAATQVIKEKQQVEQASHTAQPAASASYGGSNNAGGWSAGGGNTASAYDPYWTTTGSAYSSSATDDFNQKIRSRNIRNLTGPSRTIAPTWYKKEKRPGPPMQDLYCEVCKISCVGAQAFKTHLQGQKHKKKDELAKKTKEMEGRSGYANRHSAQYHCDLCNSEMTSKDAYTMHVNGKSHQRNRFLHAKMQTLKLHMRLGKPIPEKDPTLNIKHVRSTIPGPPDATLRSSGSTLCTKVVTGTSTMLITPKMKFEQSTTLLSTNPTDESAAAKDKGSAAPAAARTNGDTEMEPAAGKENVNEEPTKIYGEEYMPAVRGADNKITGYRCSLCECDTTDESGRVLHLKGRRHLQNYKSKVDSSIKVPPMPGQKGAKRPPPPKKARRSEPSRGERGPVPPPPPHLMVGGSGGGGSDRGDRGGPPPPMYMGPPMYRPMPYAYPLPYGMPPMPYGAGPMSHHHHAGSMMHGGPMGPAAGMGFGRGHLLPTPVPHARIRRGTKRDASESVASASDAGGERPQHYDNAQHGGDGAAGGDAGAMTMQPDAGDIDVNEQQGDGAPIVSVNDKLLFKRYRELLPTPLEAQVMEATVRDLELALRHVSDTLAEQELREKYPELQAEYDEAEKLFDKQKAASKNKPAATTEAVPVGTATTGDAAGNTAVGSTSGGGDAEMKDAEKSNPGTDVRTSQTEADATTKTAEGDAVTAVPPGGITKPRPFPTMRSLRKRRLDYLRQISGVARMGAYQNGVLLRGELQTMLMIRCEVFPNATLLKRVGDMLDELLKKMNDGKSKYKVDVCENDAVIMVESLVDEAAEAAAAAAAVKQKGTAGSQGDAVPAETPQVTVTLYMTCMQLREYEEQLMAEANPGDSQEVAVGVDAAGSAKAGETASAEVEKADGQVPPGGLRRLPLPKDRLNDTVCLQALAFHRQTRWFERQTQIFEYLRPVYLIMRDLVRRFEGLQPLDGWPMQYMTAACLETRPATPYAGFLYVLRTMASGVLLPNIGHLIDPCEMDPETTVLRTLTMEDRYLTTSEAQQIIHNISMNKLTQVLNVDDITEAESDVLERQILGMPLDPPAATGEGGEESNGAAAEKSEHATGDGGAKLTNGDAEMKTA